VKKLRKPNLKIVRWINGKISYKNNPPICSWNSKHHSFIRLMTWFKRLLSCCYKSWKWTKTGRTKKRTKLCCHFSSSLVQLLQSLKNIVNFCNVPWTDLYAPNIITFRNMLEYQPTTSLGFHLALNMIHGEIRRNRCLNSYAQHY